MLEEGYRERIKVVIKMFDFFFNISTDRKVINKVTN